jgi:4'-phosphopantetheinyl transferase
VNDPRQIRVESPDVQRTDPHERGSTSRAWASAAAWTEPRPGTLDVWSIDLRAPQGEAEILDPLERARAARFVIDAPRLQFSRARAGLRRILGRSLGRDPREIAFEIGRHGRPSLPAALATSASGTVDFNLSHSGELALVAVAFPGSARAVQLGVDVEEERGNRPFDRLAERFFAPPEVAQYRVFPAAERVSAFYRGWTRKEAYLKAWGTGLTFSSRRFVVDLDPAPSSGELLRATEMAGDDGAGWRFADLAPAAGYPGALCFRGAVEDVRRFALDPAGPAGASGAAAGDGR